MAKNAATKENTKLKTVSSKKSKKYIPEMRLGHEEVLERDVELRVLSLGAGVQSSTLLFKVLHEEIAPVDIAIFADTGNEPKEVYDWVDYLKKEAKGKVEIRTVHNDRNTGSIYDDILAADGWFAGIPVYTRNTEDNSDGMSRRQCTDRYKIQPIFKEVRNILGVENLRGRTVEMVMGISFDETQRAKYPPNKWQINTYPLVENKITRKECMHWMERKGLPKPPRSACIICPYHNNNEWNRIKTEHPKEWEEAVYFDEQLRDPKAKGQFAKRFDSELYIHKSRVPLRDASLEVVEDPQYSLFDDECEGMCGV